MYLSWIIPAYKEEKRIEKTLREVDRYIRQKQFSGGYEILVLNADSPDNTQRIVQRLENEIPNLFLHGVENKGKGWAVREGMLRAKGEIRLFSDADNSTRPDYFDTMIPFFEKGYDCVISSRHPRDAHGAFQEVPESFLRRIAGKSGNLIIQIFAVPGIWDTQNGFKAFSANAAKEIFSRLTVDGFAFDIEVLALARVLGFRVGIVPVLWKHDQDSRVTLKSYVQVLMDVFRIRWNLTTNKYGISIPRESA